MNRPTGRTLLTPSSTTALAVLLVVAMVAAVVVAVVAGRGVQSARADDHRADAAVAAATQLGVNFTTLDYRTFDRDTARVMTGATGEFRREFSAQSGELKKLVTSNKAVSKGSVLSAGLVSHDADSARVLLVVDAQVTNAAATTATPRHYRIQVDLTRAGDRWLADQLQFVG